MQLARRILVAFGIVAVLGFASLGVIALAPSQFEYRPCACGEEKLYMRDEHGRWIEVDPSRYPDARLPDAAQWLRGQFRSWRPGPST